MNRSRILLAVLATSVFLGSVEFFSFPGSVSAQESSKAGQAQEIQVPPAALQTVRGRRLAEDLRNLQRNKANLGSKHPSSPLIDSKIAEIRKRLQAWNRPSKAKETKEENPFSQRSAAPQMTESDWRQLVQELADRIEVLERKVSKLERTR